MNDDLTQYFSGEKLYGDDFSIEEIEQWYADEAEGYAELGAKVKEQYRYGYHQLNSHHAFKYLKGRQFKRALGVGSAYGDEFKPIADRIDHLTILDPSDAFSDVKEVLGTPCDYVKPNPDGSMPFEDHHFDLVTSLGVMHHIPNVSFVMNECFRCLCDGGLMLLREPIVSMGDWRKPREGLTKRERGIPVRVMDRIIKSAGFRIKRKAYCTFPIVPMIAKRIGVSAYNHGAMTLLDSVLSKAFSWNIKYSRTRTIDKFAPASAFYVLQR